MPAPCNLLDRNQTPTPCHPERSLAKIETICQTESKDPYQLGRSLGDARNFGVAICVFKEHEIPHLRISSRKAAACESPARKCRVRPTRRDESRRDVRLAPFTPRQ
jgi:hypothetical protein